MMDALFKVIDFFLPSRLLNRETRVRARMLVAFILLTFLLTGIANLEYFHQNGASKIVWFNSAILLSNLLFLGLVKVAKDHERVGVLYVINIHATNFISTVKFAPTLLNPGFQLFSFILLLGFIIVINPLKRVLLVAATLIATVSCVCSIPDPTFVRVDGFDQIGVVQAIMNFAMFIIALMLSCVAWYAYIKRISTNELAAATESHLLSLRLNEISGSLKSLVSSLKKPLDTLAAEVASLLEEKSSLTPITLANLEQNIHEARMVSQSVTWIYRAYRSENVSPTSLENFAQQLQLLLNGKLSGGRWEAEVDLKTRGCMIAGPVPVVLLLILSLADAIQLESTGDVEGQRTIAVTIDANPSEIIVTLGFQGTKDFLQNRSAAAEATTLEETEKNFRLELIAELVETSDTKLDVVGSGGESLIRIRGIKRSN